LPETYDLLESSLTAIARRPDYRMAVKQVELSGILVSFRKNQLFPSLDLVGSYGRLGFNEAGMFSDTTRQLRDEDNPRYEFGFQLRVPLFSQTERKQYRLAKNQAEQDVLSLRARHYELLKGLDNSIDNANSGYQRAVARRQAREYAEQALDAEQKKLEQGTSTSFQVLQFQRDLTSARSAEITAQADYQKALTEFYYTEGTLLDRRMITVEYED